jgi:hypothetical protein
MNVLHRLNDDSGFFGSSLGTFVHLKAKDSREKRSLGAHREQHGFIIYTAVRREQRK